MTKKNLTPNKFDFSKKVIKYLVDPASKHSLLQEVEHATHAIEILDLVFSNNCELVSSIVVEDWTTFTDHKLVIAHTNYQHRQLDTEVEAVPL